MTIDDYYDDKFHSLNQELFLIDRTLSLGLNELINANISDHKEKIYSAFFMLSHGLERMAKIALIIDAINDNRTINVRSLSHNLSDLYNACSEIFKKNKASPLSWATDILNNEILEFLSRFAQKARYFNIDSLTTSQNQAMLDPLREWEDLIEKILKNDAKKSSIAKIKDQTKIASALLSENVYVIQHSLSSKSLTFERAMETSATIAKSSPYIAWRLIQLIQEYKMLLGVLRDQNHKISSPGGKMVVPYTNDFFRYAEYDRSTAIKKKKWP